MPELEVVGTIRDRSGRFGQGFSAEFPGGLRTVLIVDPETSHLLGTETIRYQPQTVPAGLHPEDAERIAEQLKHQPTDLPVTVGWDLYQLPELVDQLP